jgi:hypothetical protein
MNVTVKKLKTFYSTEWGKDGGRDCDLYINDVKVGFVHDAGEGGEIDFYPAETPTAKIVLAEFEKYIKGLPEIDLNADKRMGDEPRMYKRSFNDFAEEAIEAAVREKNANAFARKVEKASKSGILIGVPNSGNYSKLHWGKYTLEQLMVMPRGKDTVQNGVDKTKTELKEGEVILNADYLRSLGIRV